MTPSELKELEDIQLTGGFRVIVGVLNKAIDKLKDVTDIDFDQPNIEAKCIGRALAVKWCKDILNEINLSNPKEKKSNTYE